MSRPGDPPAGVVILVGAGPGDPGLLTLRGAAALRGCDVVLYDERVAAESLDLAPATAERINVGKRGHDPPTRSQENIQKLLIERARRGETVVRLKGGDPFVFGRGGEEASACAAARVRFEVVPGVSSAIAVPGAAGIPVTDRRHSASFAVVTGHKDPTPATENTRWAELARAVDTLVILMAMRKLPELVSKLLAGGLDPGTPAAAVMHGTLPQQRVVEAPLGELAQRVREAGIGAPSVIVVGDVVRLRESLCWWERTPLFGMRVLVTRAAEQAGALAEALRRAGAEPVLVPLLRFGPARDPADLERALAQIERYHALVFSSANAVRFTVSAAARLGVDLRTATAGAVCIGPATARAAQEADLEPRAVASGGAGGGAAAMVRELAATGELAGQRLLLPQSEIARPELAQGLAAAGAQVDAVVAYRHQPPEVDATALCGQLASGEIAALSFASPSAVTAFFALLDVPARAALSRCIVAAVGETTAGALREAGVVPDVVPDSPGVQALVDALARYAVSRCPGTREGER